MSEQYLSLREVCEQLQMSEAQVRALVSSGQLESTPVAGEAKFLRSAVAAYKERVESKETVVFGEEESSATKVEDETDLDVKAGAKAPQREEDETDISEGVQEKTGKLRLEDLEEESGADESDQTSVLQPVGEAAPAEAEKEPVFEFEEDDSTSLFAEGPVSVSAAPSVENAMEEGETISLSPEDLELEEVELSETEEPSHTEMVADILREETGTGEEDALETVDLAEIEGGTAALGSEASVLAQGSSADTQLVDAGGPGGDDETIGIQSTQADTEDVGGTVLDVSAGRLEEEEEELAPISVGPVPPAPAFAAPSGDYVLVRPSVGANVCMAAGALFLLLGGVIAVFGYLGYTENPLAKFLIQNL